MPARLASIATVSAALLAAVLPAAARSDPCSDAVQALPTRPAGAPSGSEFARRVADLSGVPRDQAVLEQLRAGNVPAFLRHAVPVEFAGRSASGAALRVTLCVLPDYLAVGSDRDFLRVPLGLNAALEAAEAFGFTLPTTRIVDVIYAQATVRLAPQPLPPGDAMRSTGYVVRHNALVQAARDAARAPNTALTAGDKKDVVLTNLLWATAGRVAIYGWHRAPGAPIQPLSTVHGERYADYSHGVRLVGTTAWVDGRPMSIFDVLGSASLAGALSDEGPLARVRALAAPARVASLGDAH
ncbi:MAG TPA: hypothetical protein VLU41_17125 [Ideonella sp.]|nr:hypothetical protein [Ideonella sp.]